MEALLPCALSCFESFMAACQQHSEPNASLQLMYTSTLMRLMLDVFSQHDEDVQVTVANSIAALPGVAKSLVTMLWGSSGQCKEFQVQLIAFFLQWYTIVQIKYSRWTGYCIGLYNFYILPAASTTTRERCMYIAIESG